MPSFQVNSKWAAMSEIVAGLYISGVCALKSKNLQALDINLIVNCTKEVPNMQMMVDCERIKLWLDDTDDTDLLSHFDTVNDHIRFVLGGGGRALVHCVAGVSRSASFCLAYLMKFERMSLRQAYRYMSLRRPMVRPNLGFWKQLIQYESILRPQSRTASVRIVLVSTTKKEENGEEVRHYLPDVYLQSTNSTKEETEGEDDKENDRKSPTFQFLLSSADLFEKRRHSSGSGHLRFVPRLASVPEV
jgi:atypical dual specificity phosphatase